VSASGLALIKESQDSIGRAKDHFTLINNPDLTGLFGEIQESEAAAYYIAKQL
jgi:hypothetical protein